MQIVYIHGLNSDHTAEKGKLLDEFCQKHFPQIHVHRPNLNHAPAKVEQLLKDLIAKDPQTGLVGSSLGGFFATLMANETGKKAVLLNPSMTPHESLKRFFPEEGDNKVFDDLPNDYEQKHIKRACKKVFDDLPNDYVAMTTDTGWEMTKSDILWLEEHHQSQAKHPENILLIVKKGDELLNYQDSVDFFSQDGHQSHIIIEDGGNHRMDDFDTKLAQVVQFLFGLPLTK